MRLVADENIYAVAELFGPLGDLTVLPGRAINRRALAGADVLLARSQTGINASLLDGSQIRFAATATAGTDHVDQHWLAGAGITFASAPGANAPAVADYVLAAMAMDALARQQDPARLRVAVVGCGQVGSRVLQRLAALGCDLVAVDPPLAAAGVDTVAGVPLAPLAAVAGADVLTLHVPLQRSGRHRTEALLSAKLLSTLAADALVINASRGKVADGCALQALVDQAGSGSGDQGSSQTGNHQRLVLDVWPDEPMVPPGLHQGLLAGTAHIAGHSIDAKWQGSLQVFQALAAWLAEQGQRVPQPPNLLPQPPSPLLATAPGWQGVWQLVLAACDLRLDHQALAAALPEMTAGPSAAAAAFDRLRRGYRVRRDFSALTLQVHRQQLPAARALGFGQVRELA